MSESLDEILGAISLSVKATNESVEALSSRIYSPEIPSLVQDLLIKTKSSIPEGVSLLDLKNNAMLSYVNNLVLIILARIEALKTNKSKEVEELRLKAIKGTIVQRVVMERGIKNLEKKLDYQIDKMIRSYNKMEKESVELDKKLIKDDDISDSGDDDGDKESGDESQESEDELNYKPDTESLMIAMRKKNDSSIKKAKSSSSNADRKPETYKPPRIAAALPPSELRASNSKRGKNNKRLQAMEEYLQENSDAPMLESSTGSNIYINKGRGSIRTMKEREKEQEIKNYEESNFTRLPSSIAKKDQKGKRRGNTDSFFGEDWSIFNNRRTDMNTSRSSKPKSAWDRAKKRKTG